MILNKHISQYSWGHKFSTCNVNAILKIELIITSPEVIYDFLKMKHTEVCTKWLLFCRQHFNTLRPGQNGCHFADDIFKFLFLNENVWIPIRISLKFVFKGRIKNIPELVQIMAWHRPGDKPLSEPMMVSLPTHICVTRPQWVKCIFC